MEKFIKDNLIYLLLPIFAIIFFVYLLVGKVPETIQNFQSVEKQKQTILSGEATLKQLEEQKKEQQNNSVQKSESGKVIYEVSGQQFGTEASFGIMFDNILSNINQSGVRIHEINYDYQPINDVILSSGLSQYNACELSFVAVGTYSQFQTLFKNIAKQDYLSILTEVYIEPYDNDKTILITKFKIRIYTKTI